MAGKITDEHPNKLLQKELTELIRSSKEFSLKLKELIKEYHIDIAGERKATVEVLQIILQKWIIEILHVLFIEEHLRFNDIKRRLSTISSRTLTSKLRTLEDSEFVTRRIVGKRPTIIEYRLTEKGQTIAELSCPIICYLKLQKPLKSDKI